MKQVGDNNQFGECEYGKRKERNLTVELSDADCEQLARRCGEYGLTIGELIENFVEDLVYSIYSNGSDEVDCANQWFDRCGFSWSPEPTLLNHLLYEGYEPKQYLDILDGIEAAKKDKKRLEEHPEEADEESQWIDVDIKRWQEVLKDMIEFWKPEEEPNMAEEIERIKKWVEERNNLLKGGVNHGK